MQLQISFFGATNSGKSTLVNALALQQVSLVSPLPGTTTDPVRKRIELPGLGPCTLVDTAGYGDSGSLGAERERLTRAVIDTTDVAVLLLSGNPEDERWEALLKDAEVPVVKVHGVESAGAGKSPDFPDAGELIQRIREALPKEEEPFLTGSLVHEGSIVLLVMPQDSEAPKGRLILPQVQVLRELLDRGCIPVCCTPAQLPNALSASRPELVITDSQVFAQVNATIPPECPLTSFSILLAAAKGDIHTFIEGAKAINRLRPGDRVLIAEACTHVPDTEDIGRVKIPALPQKKVCEGSGGHDGNELRPESSGGLIIDIAAGDKFPEDISPYSLIIHCGACVATKTLVRSRIRKALRAGVPITNYGIAIAALQGILDRVSLP